MHSQIFNVTCVCNIKRLGVARGLGYLSIVYLSQLVHLTVDRGVFVRTIEVEQGCQYYSLKF